MKSNGLAADLLSFEASVDEALERCLRGHLAIGATLRATLPAACRRMGAKAAVVKVPNEENKGEFFSWGRQADIDLRALADRRQVLRKKGRVWVVHPLDVDGEIVGMTAFAFHLKVDVPSKARFVRLLCEQIDGILWAIRLARFKQRLIERVTTALTHRLFSKAVDEAVSALKKAVPFERLVLLHLDAEGLERRKLHYRVYRGARLTHHSAGAVQPRLEKAIAKEGLALISPGRHGVARALDLPNTVETLFIIGMTQSECLGQLVVSTRSGLDAFGRDLMNVFSNAVAQRLVDYRREKTHLAQFFNRKTVTELVRLPDYRRKYLRPRQECVALFFSDINSFTRICEKSLRSPSRVGRFVDDWGKGAVRIIWKHGGVFDKMIGDAVVAIFGPPFFCMNPSVRAQAAVKAALELQKYTGEFCSRPEWRGIARRAGLPGLGVAVGVNLCDASVGFFGPNQNYTAFSRGMNETARLQGVGGFREILVMDSARRALRGDRGLRFEGPFKAKVKNVDAPLKFWRVKR